MRRQYSQTSPRENIGGVICALGLPLTVIGVILTAVGYTEVEGKDHIWYFEVVGPALLGVALLAFVIGFLVRGVIDVRYFCRCFPCCKPKRLSDVWNLDELEEFTAVQRVQLIDRDGCHATHNGHGPPTT